MLAICCLSGCGQSDFRQSDSMLDLQLEIQNELDNVLGITITACDDPEEKGYFSSAEIKASYGERGRYASSQRTDIPANDSGEGHTGTQCRHDLPEILIPQRKRGELSYRKHSYIKRGMLEWRSKKVSPVGCRIDHAHALTRQWHPMRKNWRRIRGHEIPAGFRGLLYYAVATCRRIVSSSFLRTRLPIVCAKE